MTPPNSAVDLRSDTVTRPTPGMRRAIADALDGDRVGDDVYGEDPTVNTLEQAVAAMFGHESAVFVPSGIMGNQICLRLLVPPAGELLCDADAHIVTYEAGAAAQQGGIQTRTVAGPQLDVAAYAQQVRPDGWGTVPTSAIAVEQSHNRGGGLVHDLTDLQSLASLGVPLHCDGARIWNAAVASGTPLEAYGTLFATLSVCLSKGLGAPVGSVVVTSADLAAQARVLRRRLGGAMRQAGVIAAAGLYAVEHHIERLAEDHARARRLAEAVGVDPATVVTNIVAVPVKDARQVAARAEQDGVRVSVVAPDRIRLVTHLDVDDAGIDHARRVLPPLLAA